MIFANNMNRDQAPRNVGLDLQSILFDTQHYCSLNTGWFAWDDFYTEDIEISSIIQIVQELLEATVTDSIQHTYKVQGESKKVGNIKINSLKM